MSKGADDFIVGVINGLLLHVNDDKERSADTFSPSFNNIFLDQISNS